jgi:hypothetical protein
MNNHGLQIEDPKPEDYVFGGNQLGDSPIQPDANWSGYLPDVEIQNLNGIEPSACVTFATLNIVEILERKLYGGTNNWSDRFLATISGTKERKGNSPNNVAYVLKDKGCVEERDLPFDSSITTYDSFYALIKESLHTLALQFKAEFAFGYEYVKPNHDDLMDALKYSPLGFSVYAWIQDENGLYYRPSGASDGHYTVCIGYVRNNYWIIFDSYAPNGSAIKHVKWDSLPLVAYRYTLLRQVASESAWDRFIKLLRSILGV